MNRFIRYEKSYLTFKRLINMGFNRISNIEEYLEKMPSANTKDHRNKRKSLRIGSLNVKTVFKISKRLIILSYL